MLSVAAIRIDGAGTRYRAVKRQGEYRRKPRRELHRSRQNDRGGDQRAVRHDGQESAVQPEPNHHFRLLAVGRQDDPRTRLFRT